MFSLANQHVVVTGCNGLIGSSLLPGLCQLGARLTLIDLASTLTPEYHPESTSFRYYQADVTSSSQIRDTIQNAVNFYGPVNSLLALAAINPKVDIDSPEPILRVQILASDHFNVSIEGSRNAALSCYEFRAETLSIVFVGSDLSVIAPYHPLYTETLGPDASKPYEYSVVKHALVGLCKYYATLWAKDSVRCNLLCPSGVENPGMPNKFKLKLASLSPANRLLTLAELLGPAVFLLSDMSSYVNGQSLIVDGGRTAW